MKYIAYCRKSTEDETHQAQSIETQERILKEYSTNNNLEIADFIIETKSAKDDGNRPEFENMLKKFEKGEADGLLVCHIDRISRNWIEAGRISKLHDLGLIKEIRTPSKIYNSATDMFMMGIELASATYYSRNLSARVKEGIETKLKKGEYGAPAPLGYKNNHGNIIPNKKTSHFIQEIFELYSTGDYSINQITEKLYLNGFRTHKANKKVYKSVIHRILTNPVYYGVIVSKGKEYQGSYKPLISKSLFTKVQYLLNKANHSKTQKHNFLFNNYLICEKCGCQFTSTIKKNRHIYYYCTNGKHICDEHFKYLNEKDVDKLISQVIADITINPKMAKTSLNLYAEDLKKENSNKIGVSQIINDQIDNLKKKKNRLLDLLLNKQIDDKTYNDKKLEIENEITALEDRKNHSKFDDLDTTLELLKKFKNTAISLKKMYDYGNREVKENLLKSVLWNASIQNQNIQKVTYKKPYEYLKKAVNCDDFLVWRARWDSNPRSSA